MSAPTIVFDLDGTLVDTAPDLVATLNALFASEGLRPVDFAAARRLIGGGIRPFIERGLMEEGIAVVPADVDRLFEDFIERYAAHIADLSRPFPGARAALDRLTGRGCRLAVCTNKLEWLAVRLLDRLDLSRHFPVVCGPDTFDVRKPDPRMLHQTIARAGGSSQRAVMVGDSAADIDTARAAGVPVVAVDFGYCETDVAALAPDRLISHYDELPDAVEDLLGGPAASK